MKGVSTGWSMKVCQNVTLSFIRTHNRNLNKVKLRLAGQKRLNRRFKK